MVNLMGLLLEVMASMITLVTKPFVLCKSIFFFGFRAILIVIQTWVELVKTTISIHLNILRKTIVGIIALISLPVRVVTAMQRERLLERQLAELLNELDDLVNGRTELEHLLRTATKECRILESMLADVEEEYGRAIAKIELLESELQNLKVENFKLKGALGKEQSSVRGHHVRDNGQNVRMTGNYGISHWLQSWKSQYEGSGIVFRDQITDKDTWENKDKSNPELLKFLKSGFIASGSIQYSFEPGLFSWDIVTNDDLEQRRDLALSQSLFSVILSLLVGIIVWEADGLCIPLVLGLFAVAAMSLKSVVQFFCSMKNKPASDAVALLSLNCFILGTISYPALPRVGHVFDTLTLAILSRTMNWLGISCH